MVVMEKAVISEPKCGVCLVVRTVVSSTCHAGRLPCLHPHRSEVCRAVVALTRMQDVFLQRKKKLTWKLLKWMVLLSLPPKETRGLTGSPFLNKEEHHQRFRALEGTDISSVLVAEAWQGSQQRN